MVILNTTSVHPPLSKKNQHKNTTQETHKYTYIVDMPKGQVNILSVSWNKTVECCWNLTEVASKRPEEQNTISVQKHLTM